MKLMKTGSKQVNAHDIAWPRKNIVPSKDNVKLYKTMN